MIKYNEYCKWNQNSYGSAIRVKKNLIRTILVTLGIIVPVIVPVPLMVYIASKIKSDVIYRY